MTGCGTEEVRGSGESEETEGIGVCEEEGVE